MDIPKFSSYSLTQPYAAQPATTLSTKNVKTDDGVKLMPPQPPSLTQLYQPKPIYIQHSISNTTQNSEQTQYFANQLNDEVSDNRFKGLGARFNELLDKPNEPYQQELRRYSYHSQNGRAGNVDFSEFEVSSKTKTQAFNLDLKTKSGATIQFSI